MASNNKAPYSFIDLFDIEEIQKIQDAFALATGVASIITDIDGIPITNPSNFTCFCSELIRTSEIGLKNCMLSDSIIGLPKKDGPRIQKCLSGGLYDAGASIIVDGHHIASWLLGQILEKNYDINSMLNYADIIGVDKELYKQELEKVTQMDLEQFNKICDYLYIMAQQISTMAVKNLQLKAHIKEMQDAELVIRRLSYYDYLTNIYNRRFYEEELNRLDVKRNLPLTIVLGDVNGLKLINDSFGHVMGDKLLIIIAEILKSACRDDDIVARLGGDEFVIVLPKTSKAEAQGLLRRIKTSISKKTLGHFSLSVSFGLDTKIDETYSIEKLFKTAENHMYKNKLHESPSMRSNAIDAIFKTLHEKNKREEAHSNRVAKLCANMGVALKMTPENINELETIGRLHDIGKIAISETILNKPGKLTTKEWNEVKRHPEIGYRILSTVNELSDIADIVLYHHERYDGNGYPKQIKGEEIPYISRILTIVDSYDAMTSSRSYRDANSEEFALNELKTNAGSQFDPALVDVFINQCHRR